MFLLLRHCFIFAAVIQLSFSAEAKTLHFAAETGDTARVRELLDQGVEVDKRDNRGRTALIYAASRGHLAIINMLLAQGADVHAEGQHQQNPLSAAIMRNRVLVVKRLIGAGADIHFGDLEGNLPLFTAVEQGFSDIVRVLLENGASANTLSPQNEHVLRVARDGDHQEIAELLLKHGADPNARVSGRLSVATNMDTLLIKKALEEGGELGDTALVQKLVDHGVDINAKTDDDVTALMIATGLGNVSLMQILLNAGADPLLLDKYGRTALAYTAFIRDQEMRQKVAEVLRLVIRGRQIRR